MKSLKINKYLFIVILYWSFSSILLINITLYNGNLFSNWVVSGKLKHMTKRLLILIVFLFNLIAVKGQSKTEFPNLTTVSIDTSLNVFFGYDNKTTHFINKPCWMLNKSAPRYCDKDSVPVEWIIVAKFKYEKLSDSVLIVYSPGLSEDPGYCIYTNNNEVIRSFHCLHFYINSSGIIYTSGHTNNMFNRRRKFQFKYDSIVEIIQPYSYVGLKGKTLKGITLYKEKTGNDIIAQLPIGCEIEILLADATTKDFEFDLNFLVRTDFGLVGWLRMEEFTEPIIEGLYYAGD